MTINKSEKIGILIDRLNVGGVEKIAIEEVIALRKLGYNAYLVILKRKGVINNAFEDLRKDLPTIYLDDRLPKFLTLSFKFPVFNFFSLFHITYPFLIPFVIKNNEFNYLIVHGTYTAFTAISIKKIRAIKYSVFIWDPIGYILHKAYSGKFSIFTNPLSYIALLLDKLIITHAEYILVGGNAHNKYIIRINSKAKIKTVTPSVHPLIKLRLKKDDFLLLVTAWKKGKSPEIILKILEKIPNLKVKMVGKWIDNGYKKEFERLVKNKGFEKNLDVVGSVSESKLSSYYARALAIFQINDDKGFGMPALEAAGHGTTFIIPKGQGVCSLFINQEDGFFIKEKDITNSVRLISKLLNNKNSAIKMGVSAWKKVKNKYNWENHANKLINIVNLNT